ncbi:hypothetical protein [Sporomusa termitida]|nr:hypothetical protein [Sporomusa termitida]
MIILILKLMFGKSGKPAVSATAGLIVYCREISGHYLYFFW